MDKKNFFEQQIADQKPKKVKKEVVWTPKQGNDDYGAHTSYRSQTKKQMGLGPPPEKKSLADLP